MRRVSLFLTTLIIAALLLAACGGEETSTSLPATNVPPVTVAVTDTAEATEPAVTETASTDMTTTPVVPVTGENSPARISNLIGMSVCGIGGDELASVQDLVLDFDQTMVTYVIVDANGRSVAVPWESLTMPAAGSSSTGSESQAAATATTSAGTSTESTATATVGTVAETTATSVSGTGSTDIGSGAVSQLNCLALTVDDDMFINAPDFDASTLPAQGQPATGWDDPIVSYWSGGGTGTSGTSVTATASTPEAGATATSETGTEAATATSTGAGTGVGNGTGQSAQKMQGVILATDILGATVSISPQGQDQGTGSGIGTDVQATATSGTDTTAPTATSTTGSGTGAATETSTTGSGTGTGTGTQGTVEDVVIEPASGELQYLVISTATGENWIPIPIGFLRWDASTNSVILMINENALQNAPAFSPDQFPATSAAGWDQEISDFWQNNGGTGTGSEAATATP